MMTRSERLGNLLVAAQHHLVMAAADIGFARDDVSFPALALERAEAIFADAARARNAMRKLLEDLGVMTPLPETDEIPF